MLGCSVAQLLLLTTPRKEEPDKPLHKYACAIALASHKGKKMADENASLGGADGPNTKRLDFKKQSLDDAYAAPANLLEIEVCNAETHGFGRNRYTDYEVKMRVSYALRVTGTLYSSVWPLCVTLESNLI